jgi:Ca2+-binding EF-hand superfamily protein
LRGWFAAVDRDRSGEVSAQELTQMSFGPTKFSLPTSQMLIRVFDSDGSGQIGFFEYCVLHKFIIGMQTAFYAHDKDGSHKLDLQETTAALGQGGFRFSPSTVEKLFNRFAKVTYGAQKGLDYESFIQLCAYLGTVRSVFESQDTDRDGWVQINLEGLVQLSSSLPK